MDLDVLLRAETLRLIDEVGPIASAQDVAAALTRLRAAGHAPEVAAAVMTQARLRAKAAAKFGGFASGMLFTEDGLQQATRLAVAARHAARFRDAGIGRVADLGCGIGGDALAFAGLGIGVNAVERDPVTAAIAAYNLAAFPDVAVEAGDAETADLDGVAGVWLDPARRRGATRLPDPADWSPSLDFAFGLGRRLPAGVKLGPGIDRGLLPEGAEAQWVSDGGEVVELAVWFGALARPGVGRAALVLGADGAHELTAPADSPDVEAGELGAYLVEPDGAVIRARLIGDLARALDARTLHPTIAYLTCDAPPSTPFGAAFRVIQTLPVDAKAIRRALAERGVGSLEIKKRGVDVDPEAFRRQVLPKPRPGGGSAVLVLTRLGERRRALLCERLSPARRPGIPSENAGSGGGIGGFATE